MIAGYGGGDGHEVLVLVPLPPQIQTTCKDGFVSERTGSGPDVSASRGNIESEGCSGMVPGRRIFRVLQFDTGPRTWPSVCSEILSPACAWACV